MAWTKTKFCTGFERNCPWSSGIPGEYFYWYGDPSSSNDVVMGVTNEDAHTGNYSLKISGTTSDDWLSARWLMNWRSKVAIGFWYKPSLIYGSDDETCVFSIMADDSTWPVRIYWDEAGTFYGMHNVMGVMGSLGGFPPGEWVHVGILYYNNPSPWGRYGLWLNGKEVFSFSGETNTSTYRDLYYFYFGSYPHDVSRNQGTPVGAFYDNPYVMRGNYNEADLVPPDSRFLDIAPDGDGYHTEWAPSVQSPPLASLYEAVNSVQSTDRPNIKAWENDLLVSFTMENIASVGLAIPTVITRGDISAYPGNAEAYIGIRTGGVDQFSAVDEGAPSWAKYIYILDKDAQSNDWTESSVNTMEIAFKGSQL